MANSFENIILGNSYIGLELFAHENGDKLCILEVAKRNNQLVILKEDIRSFSPELIQNLSKVASVSLVVNTNQVLQKEISEIDIKEKKILQASFPNISWEDFYYEIWKTEFTTVISICRKSYLHELIELFKKNGVLLSQIKLGNSSLANLKGFYNDNLVETNLHHINFKNTNSTINKREILTSKNYKINGLSIHNSQVLSFSSLLSFFSIYNLSGTNLDVLNEKNRDLFFQKILFKKSLFISTAILLTCLLINFFLFNHFYKKYLENESYLQQNKMNRRLISSLKKEIKEEESLAMKIYGNTSSSIALINEITKHVPSSILLKEFIYQPLNQGIKENEDVNFNTNEMIISGITNQNEDFTHWISILERNNQVKKITILNFGKNENNENCFTIKILTNEVKQ